MQLSKSRELLPELVYLDRVDSTNLELSRKLGPNLPQFSAVVAGEQTAGQGRLGRNWISQPEASLSLSVLLRPQTEAQTRFVTLLAANIVHRSLVSLTGRDDFSIKWPNDVLFQGRKVSGILASLHQGAVVLGIGVNLKQQPAAPEQAFALSELGEFTFDQVLAELLEQIIRAWEGVLGGDEMSELEYLRAHCSTLGQEVRAELPDGTSITGVAQEITAQGHLIIAGDTRTELAAADVWHLRN